MTLATPVLSKTWEIVSNQVIPDDSTVVNGVTTDRRDLLFHIKATLTGGAFTVPWVVTMSSDGSANAGAADHWATAANIVWGIDGADPNTATRSWIVLNNTAMGVHVLIDCTDGASASGARMDMWLSETAYTDDGTITARPTNAGVEHQLFNRVNTNDREWGSGGGGTYVCHIWQSNDGLHTRIQAPSSDTHYAFHWMFGTMETAVGPPNHLWYFLGNKRAGGSADMNSITNLNESGTFRLFFADQTNTLVNGLITCPMSPVAVDSWDSVPGLATAPTPYGGRVLFAQASIWCEAVGYVLELDIIPDFWWGPFASTNYEGKTWPAASRDFIQFNNVVLPWDGSIPILAAV